MTTLVLDRAEFKATTTDTGTRTLDFYAMAFSDTPDANGDIIDHGAADAWLQSFYAEGKALPISFAHSAMWDMTDPGRFIGYAPADADHVWIDDYGVRVKAVLNTDADGPMGENARAAARLVDQRVVGGASITYLAEKSKEVGGVRHITQLSIFEAGPCLVPANPDAVILGIKTADGQIVLATKEASAESVDATLALILGAADVVAFESKAVDASAWDKNEAMGMCESAADYRSICAAEHTTGTPDQRQHWAGPHHYLGKGPNEDGVRAALSRWGTTFGDTQLDNVTEEQWRAGLTHLQSHMDEINPTKSDDPELENAVETADDVETKHAFSPKHIQGAHDALVRAGAKCVLDASKSAPPADDTDEDVDETLRRLRFIKTSLV